MYYNFATFVSIITFTISSIECSERGKKMLEINSEPKEYGLCSNLSLICTATPGNENSDKLLWFINNTELLNGPRIISEVRNCSDGNLCAKLNIHCLTLDDIGNYTCKLTSENETVSSSPYLVTVNVPAVISTKGERINAGETATLTCTFTGVNEKTIKWFKGNDNNYDQLGHIANNKLNESTIESVLNIKAVNLKNNGTYYCNASDGKIEVSERVPLIVLDVPDIVIDIAKAIGTDQIYLNWTVNDGNSLVEQYFIQYLKSGSNDWNYFNEFINGTNTSFIIRNLERNSAYKLRIQAKNAIGKSQFREYPYVTTLKEDVNFVPELSVKGVTQNSIDIGWTLPPPELKEHIHFYKLLLCDDKGCKETLSADRTINTYMFVHLQFAKQYSIKIVACNDITGCSNNWSKSINSSTLDGVPDPPEITNTFCGYDKSGSTYIRLSWLPPKNINGEIVFYSLTLVGTAIYYDEDGNLQNITLPSETKTTKGVSTYFERVDPNTNYTIYVSAKTRSMENGKQVQTNCTIPPTVPGKEWLNDVKWEKIQENNKWFLKLSKLRIPERNGTICCCRIFIIKLNNEQVLADLPSPGDTTISSYYYVHNYLKHGAYLADIFDNNFLNENIILGDEKSIAKENNLRCNKCPVSTPAIHDVLMEPFFDRSFLTSSLANTYSTALESNKIRDSSSKRLAPYSSDREQFFSAKLTEILANSTHDGLLDENSNYTGFLQFIVYGGKEASKDTYSNYFNILNPGRLKLEPPENADVFSGFLQFCYLQVLIGFGCIVFIVLVSFCMLQHYTKQVAEAQGVEMTLRNSFRHLCQSLRGSHLPVSSNPPDVLPISRSGLLAAYIELSKDSDYGFEQEFEMLPDRFTDRTTKASEARENACKNRYPDVKAYDQTRVKLSQIDGIIGSDYINANYVVSYKERKKFICAQGPMENTVCDFWRMIWEQQLEIILMLTNLEEYSKTKCAKYWPDKDEKCITFGDYVVHYIKETPYSDYVIRKLEVVHNTSQNTESEKRSIYQYHFLVWKDFQAPEHPSGILKFIRRVNEAYSYEKGPILVHCSAGVGRTGTLVALDSLLQQLECEGQVLIFNTICDLRRQRNFLVQSLKQYIFVYRTLLEYAHFGNTEIKVGDLRLTIDKLKLKECDNGKGKSRMEEEFDKLSFTINNQEMKSLSVGSTPENAAKNRDTFIIPFDRNRVILTPIPGCEHSTYINASFIEGYDNSESFIITQDPIIDSTVTDFWRMIFEQNISTIVMLSSLLDGPKRCPRYWPDEEFTYGNIKVKHIQSESCPYYTRREFYVTNVKMDENLVVVQYQYNGWPTAEGAVPEVTRGLIELVNCTARNSVDVGEIISPIVVHCELGSDRSSMFVALSILSQQLRVERRVDVATVSRKLRSQRRGMLNSFAQYEFLYRAILNYADLHHLTEHDIP